MDDRKDQTIGKHSAAVYRSVRDAAADVFQGYRRMMHFDHARVTIRSTTTHVTKALFRTQEGVSLTRNGGAFVADGFRFRINNGAVSRDHYDPHEIRVTPNRLAAGEWLDWLYVWVHEPHLRVFDVWAVVPVEPSRPVSGTQTSRYPLVDGKRWSWHKKIRPVQDEFEQGRLFE